MKTFLELQKSKIFGAPKSESFSWKKLLSKKSLVKKDKTFLEPRKIEDFLGPKKQSFLRKKLLSKKNWRVK